MSSTTLAQFVAPANQEVLTVSVAYTVTVSAPRDTAVNFYVDGVDQGAMTAAGAGVFTFAYTPGAIASSVSLSFVGNVTGASSAIIVTVAEANILTTNVNSWTKSSGVTVTSGHADPDGGNNAYRVQIPVSAGVSRYVYTPTLTTPSDPNHSIDIWVKPWGDCKTILFSWGGGTGGAAYITLDDGQTSVNKFAAAIVEKKADGFVRVQVKRTTGAASTHFFLYACNTVGDNTVDVDSTQAAAGFGFYIYDPRWVGSTTLPLTFAQRMSAYYVSTTSGVELWNWGHDAVNDAATDSTTGLECQVIKPTGWSNNGTYNAVYVLRALLDSTESGLGNLTPVEVFSAQGYADTYNCVLIFPKDRGGNYWWGCKADGTANMHDALAKGFTKFAREKLGAGTSRSYHSIIGYSKSGWAATSLILRNSTEFERIVVYDVAYKNVYPNNIASAGYDTIAQYNLYDPMTNLSTYQSSVNDKPRLILMGYYAFRNDLAEFAAACKRLNIPHAFIETPGSAHQWNSAWTDVAMANLFATDAALVAQQVQVMNMASNVRLPGNAGSANSNGTNTTQRARTYHYNETDTTITHLQLAFPGWKIDTTNESDMANGYTVTASIEYPLGSYTQVKFNWSTAAAGAASATVATGENKLSDVVTLATGIPAGAKFGIGNFVSVTAGQVWPTSGAMVTALSELGEHGVGLADCTMGGTITGTTASLRPAAIIGIGKGMKRVSLACVGDSIQAGASDGNFDTNGNTAWSQRAATNRCPVIVGAVSGTRLNNQVLTNKMQRRLDLMQKAGITRVLQGWGVNDVTSGDSVSTVTANMTTMYGLIRSIGALPYQVTITPVSASTELWLYENSQTVVATGMTGGSSSVRALVNDWIRAGGGGMAGYIECADIVETSRNSGIFKATSVSSSYLAAKDTWTTGAGSTTTVINSAHGKATDYYRYGGGVKYTSGALAGTFKQVASNTTTTITVSSAFGSAPSNGDTFEAIPVKAAMTTDGTHPRFSGETEGGIPALRDNFKTIIDAWLA